MSKKFILIVKKIFLFTVIFSIFICGTVAFALEKADWISNYTSGGTIENTPIGADTEYPKMFTENGFNILLTKSEHIAEQWVRKINQVVKQRGLTPKHDHYYYEDGEFVKQNIEQWDGGYWPGERYLLYEEGEDYGLEYTRLELDGSGYEVLHKLMYKNEDGEYAQSEWMDLDIDFDGQLEKVYFKEDGRMLQWTENIYPKDKFWDNYEMPENAIASDIVFSIYWTYENGQMAYNNENTDEVSEFYFDPIGRLVDENGIIQRP